MTHKQLSEMLGRFVLMRPESSGLTGIRCTLEASRNAMLKVASLLELLTGDACAETLPPDTKRYLEEHLEESLHYFPSPDELRSMIATYEEQLRTVIASAISQRKGYDGEAVDDPFPPIP